MRWDNEEHKRKFEEAPAWERIAVAGVKARQNAAMLINGIKAVSERGLIQDMADLFAAEKMVYGIAMQSAGWANLLLDAMDEVWSAGFSTAREGGTYASYDDSPYGPPTADLGGVE